MPSNRHLVTEVLIPTQTWLYKVPLWLLRHNPTRLLQTCEPTFEVDILTTSIVLYCKELLELMPKAGMRELYACCVSKFGPKMVIGRDRCYDIFRSNGLCQRTSRKRPKTTNSNHNYYIYPDLLNVAPKFVATRLGAMVVADITYVNTGQGLGLPLVAYRCVKSCHHWDMRFTKLLRRRALESFGDGNIILWEVSHRHEHSYSSFRPGCPILLK